MDNQFGSVKKLIIRRFKFKLAPLLISKEDYWGYINTSQMFYKARTVINFKTIAVFFLIMMVIMYLYGQPNISQIELIILLIMTATFGFPTLVAAKNKFWITFFMSALLFLGISVMIIFSDWMPDLIWLAIITGYLSLSHLIMLIRVRKMAAIQSI